MPGSGLPSTIINQNAFKKGLLGTGGDWLQRTLTPFKTAALNHSAISPCCETLIRRGLVLTRLGRTYCARPSNPGAAIVPSSTSADLGAKQCGARNNPAQRTVVANGAVEVNQPGIGMVDDQIVDLGKIAI